MRLTPQQEQFDLCGALGHAMEPYEVEQRSRSSVGWVWMLCCARCGTKRRDVHDIRGRVNTRGYKMSPGYRSHRDAERGMARADYKLRVKRTMVRKMRGDS